MKGARGWTVTLIVLVGVVVLWEIAERLVAARFPLVPAPSAIGGAIGAIGDAGRLTRPRARVARVAR